MTSAANDGLHRVGAPHLLGRGIKGPMFRVSMKPDSTLSEVGSSVLLRVKPLSCGQLVCGFFVRL